MGINVLPLLVLVPLLVNEALSADLQKFRDNFVNIDNMRQDNENVYFQNIHGVPTNLYAVGICNPNLARVINRNTTVPRRPRLLAYPRCLPYGPIGIAINSVAFYHPLAGGYVNAVEGGATEGFDICGGHADPTESYHYHKIPEKHLNPLERRGNSLAPHKHLCPYEEGQIDKIIGVGNDGYLIYGPKVTIGGVVYDFRNTNSPATGIELDECHGIEIDAEGDYVYIASDVFPYVMGCFRGEPDLDPPFDTISNYECRTISRGELCDCCMGTLTRNDVTEEDDQCPYTCTYNKTGEFGNLPPPTSENEDNGQNNVGGGNQGRGSGSYGPFRPMQPRWSGPRSPFIDLFQPRRGIRPGPPKTPFQPRGGMFPQPLFNDPREWFSFNSRGVQPGNRPIPQKVSGTYIPTNNIIGVGAGQQQGGRGNVNNNNNSNNNDNNDNNNNNNGDTQVIPERCLNQGPPKGGPPKGGEGGPPKKKGPPGNDNCPLNGLQMVGNRRKRAVLDDLIRKLAAFN